MTRPASGQLFACARTAQSGDQSRRPLAMFTMRLI